MKLIGNNHLANIEIMDEETEACRWYEVYDDAINSGLILIDIKGSKVEMIAENRNDLETQLRMDGKKIINITGEL